MNERKETRPANQIGFEVGVHERGNHKKKISVHGEGKRNEENFVPCMQCGFSPRRK